MVKSPGIPEKAPIIQALREKKIPIISEIEFAGRYTQAKCICITGTNGKTTTTLLTYHLLKAAGLSVGLAGNVGYSLAEQVIEDKHDYYVVELSSFQLDDTYDFQPWIAVLLNITPDHLDRYDYSLENYAQSKLRIARNQDSNGTFIYNADDEIFSDTSSRLFWRRVKCRSACTTAPICTWRVTTQPKLRSAPTCARLLRAEARGNQYCKFAAHRPAQPPEYAGCRAGCPRRRPQHGAD